MELFLLILGMTLVTALPRVIPVFIMDKLNLPIWANRWLQTIPYAALGALIFPGILSVEPSFKIIGISGGIIAAIMAYFNIHVMYTIFVCIGYVMLIKSLFL
ncbi:MAG: AzlD domain-containing protein [Clostridiales bacterium]|nr:AzlD domain-containing protein [Clostridiales bacterium]